ncbi:hypothetical protein JX265_005361 [Neoarthrinium moseri]|uniref:UDP-glucuronic acid decarboxylase 1 n=1 Tax=Neoarthrinium moseri TaxID=1658444 RepID=A0A9Q0AQ23_9PEZI|nr:uncharacterized protein JN550_006182 [Neoarthrinium moseri]KAI1845671.1 hypothetical protein JX266_008282 [Neoarthrinium moseri]KAI1868607.1 hypothetical protein JN550_006182 [Neoarthrinium moseri]KAI1872481.1 hypothetical protein JX265_005361 [Neoarthrinium moseri]
MCIIVTGGAGFIGSHLVERLLEDGHEVVAIDSLWTGSTKNVKKFEENKNFRFIEHDVRHSLPNITGVTAIYHLACPASPDHFEESPIEILETCFVGTKNMLDFAVGCGARILIASTSEIYGDPKVIPQSENYWGNTNSFGPRSCYDEGKRITEALAYGYQRKHSLKVRIARIFNAYGPGMQLNDGRAVPNFIVAAMKGQPLTIYGDGSATRCFQFVTDCVAGLNALMNSEYSRPVNIGSDVETKVGEIAEMIVELVANKVGSATRAPVNHLPARQDDPYRRKPDIGLAKDVLEWKPVVNLREGLDVTVNWFLEKEQKSNGTNGTNGHI